jgi:hypothetical protein
VQAPANSAPLKYTMAGNYTVDSGFTTEYVLGKTGNWRLETIFDIDNNIYHYNDDPIDHYTIAVEQTLFLGNKKLQGAGYLDTSTLKFNTQPANILHIQFYSSFINNIDLTAAESAYCLHVIGHPCHRSGTNAPIDVSSEISLYQSGEYPLLSNPNWTQSYNDQQHMIYLTMSGIFYSWETPVHLGYNNDDGFLRLETRSAQLTAVPEPFSWILMISGFFIVGVRMRQQKCELLSCGNKSRYTN